ncbi:diguanylate cyclase [Persicimonas caeni]|uniref:Diguanylate cyclase n=1 Tax=Persicimonas caeni TaxID=2292766 RepID=A0A4Y6PLK2_PERCE|nr:diguanylate cyclase [Persicimonas caeni]QDG49204.1 diguanylate cyclase [Persicimonas caeni]QED30425.1 diguanylate cyclase [Persicimonas caeni]
MYRILVFSTDSSFQDRLQQAAEACSLQLVVADEVGAVVDHLDEASFDAVLVDDTAAELADDERSRLISAGGTQTPLFAVGEETFESLPEHAHLGDDVDLTDLLDDLADLVAQRGVLSERPESGAYFPSDTQGRPYLKTTDGLDRHTSHVEVDDGAAVRLLYVGRPSGFRQRLEEAAEGVVELVLVDSPHEVVVPAGAPPIDLVVLSVEGELGTTRRLIRYLRRRQPESPFELILLAEADEEMGDGLGRTLGADLVLEQPIKPAELIERAQMRQATDANELLVISADATRQALFRTALSREPIDTLFASSVEDIASEGGEPPEIVLVDTVGTEIDAAATIEQLRRRFPFAATRYLVTLEAADSVAAQARESFDDVITAPFLPSDIRRLVRLHLAQASMGRAALERDHLTGVNSILALGDHLQALLDETAEVGELVVLTAVDIDNLGQINYRYGKVVGDTVLRSLADALHLATGQRNAIYRSDADEFFLLQRIDESEWLETRDRLDRALHVFRQQTFRAVDGRGTYATASAGCVVVPPVGASAEYCLRKSWIVLERASSTRQQRLLVAQLDPAAVPRPARSRDLSDERD